MTVKLTRRGLLAAGFSLSLLGDAAFAASAAGHKLVVIIARGGMDGLSLSPPIGDPDYATLRGPIAIPAGAALKLDGIFALHPKLVNLHRLSQAGQARIAPAVAIPARIRSHFDAQDLLETGAARVYGASTGWLNRALDTGPTPIKALSVGAQTPLILRGPVQAQSWSAGRGLDDQADRLASMLQDLYAGDTLLGPAFAAGLQTEAMADSFNGGKPLEAKDARTLALSTARFLTAPGGPSIAVLSQGGYDTHSSQGGVDGQLANRFRVLDETLAGLESGLGPAWKNTVVVVVTEFGRTARVNGTLGLDHGTASTLVLAGGALKPGGIVGDWPGLAPAALFEDRDLAPTLDVRSVFKGLLVDHLGLDAARVDAAVFPESGKARALSGLV